ncbi:L-glyceraldehyde 3-phosphate reductase [Clavibacter michiganensis subsp. michiganensis]|uniref:L-glyceraldehyde 3-phosphate reductase n=1 Tax=Clavibacter michiganensis subsp. michiganensis TaxID=33013 RepID=A0A251XNA5_CLAMM|nr:L-glyceraldehyde 3-phosphate reductase [Clavibacter michiganensis subsp. michiganensis]OUE04870.1 L-glyceraldehyde 3-phosphate reductase [Clavibacter michiganensis subsp. michiganensis]
MEGPPRTRAGRAPSVRSADDLRRSFRSLLVHAVPPLRPLGPQAPELSLGLWHNFGTARPIDTQRAIVRRAFDLGITHFDLANNYGPPPGSAETAFGRILAEDLRPYRDEIVISSKAGYLMWDGPYGEWGSRKSMLASLDQSLGRMGLEYVDVFYSHRPDPETPIEETMGALATAVHQGKALYAGISNYSPEQTERAVAALAEHKVPLTIHQPSYSMFNRHVEGGLLPVLEEAGSGCIVFSPLAQGLLTDRYLSGSIPPTRGPRPAGSSTSPRSRPSTWSGRAACRRSPRGAGRRSRSSRSRGCCGTRGSRAR